MKILKTQFTIIFKKSLMKCTLFVIAKVSTNIVSMSVCCLTTTLLNYKQVFFKLNENTLLDLPIYKLDWQVFPTKRTKQMWIS